MYPIMRLILGTIVILVILRQSQAQEPTWKPDFDLFSVRTIVNRRLEDKPTYRLYERYSASQSRAIINYKVDENLAFEHEKNLKHIDGQFFIDSENDFSIHYTREDKRCAKISPNQLMQKLKLTDIDVDLNVPEFIAGPAKWLFFAKHNRNSKYVAKGVTRNTPSFEYSYSLNQGISQSYNLKMFFSQADIGKDYRNAFPLLIEIEENGVLVATLEFFGPELGMRITDHEEVNGVVKDPFMFDLLSDRCREILFNNKKVPELEWTKSETKTGSVLNKRFSFRARIENFDHEWLGYEVFIAYDSVMKILRIDRDRQDIAMGSRQVVDFKAMKQYHIFTPDKEAEAEENCVTTNISPANAKLGDWTAAKQILFGFSSAKYVGKARVRDRNVLVYSMKEGTLPFWLDQPVTTVDLNNIQKSRNSTSFNGNKSLLRDFEIIIYMTDTEVQVPIRMEILCIDPKSTEIVGKLIIEIYEFLWSIENHAFNGDSSLELFSIANLCAFQRNKNERAKVELLLDVADYSEQTKSRLNWLSVHERNLLLISSLENDWELRVPMVSDFESKIVQVERDGSIKTQLVVSFIYDYPEKVSIDIVDIGFGQIKYPMTKIKGRIVSSMFQCFMLAAAQKFDVHFAFSSADMFMKACYIDMVPRKEAVGNDELPFDVKNDGPYRVFYKRKVEERSRREAYWLANLGSDQLQLDTNILRLELGDSKPPLVTKLVRRHIEDLSDGSDLSHESHQFKTSSYIERVGLVEQAEISKKIEVASSLAQCRSTCYTDLECKSYSLCIRGSDVECIVSNIGLDSEENVKKIIEAAKSASGLFEVDIKENSKDIETKVKFNKRPACTTYKKFYLDYFTSYGGKPLGGMLNSYLLPVDNQEQCAEFCIQYNLHKFSNLSEQIKKSLDSIENAINKNDLKLSKDAGKMYVGINRLEGPLNHFCHHYYYINYDDVSDGIEEDKIKYIYRQALESVELEKKAEPFVTDILPVTDKSFAPHRTDYCNLVLPGTQTHSILSDNRGSTRHHQFIFKAIYFYHETYGVSLKGTKMSEEQLFALGSVLRSEPTLEHLKLAYQVVKNTDNHQVALPITKSECARTCINQPLGPFPACKSFDIVEGMFEDGHYRTMCYLNSITLAEALARKRTDLINFSSSSDNLQHWHFEPNVGMDIESTLSGDQYVLTAMNGLTEQSKNLFGTFGLTLIAIMGIVLGTYCGAYIGKRYLPVIYAQRNNRSTSMCSLAPVIELPESIKTIDGI